ncbi:MAG: UDP-N-acetylmuramoyl-L-alanyl-D-glutamate--2,6-diaminopimelate ligase [Deltaproteobacteria bacterium]|nr:UDP-N-acetylmuramoyl-L-alanyl-D-glutamate--2,6-diaminopimelate ligase [Deltaproteobacteria bacterium]
MVTPKASVGQSLKDLATRLGLTALGGEAWVTGLTEDSRAVRPGDIFAAIKGLGQDGRDFIEAARLSGAAAIVLEEPDLPVGPRLLHSGQTGYRAVVNQLAREVYGYPDRALKLIGVTGTNGKSTICYLLESVLLAHQQKVGVLGTINYRWPGQLRPAPNTTPEGALLSRTLADMVKDGCQAAIMEVSSHALELGRVAGLAFELALFTNLTQDHLDFHGDFARYFAAKKKLFLERLIADGQTRALVGVDDSYGAILREELGPRAHGYGFSPEAEVRGDNLKVDLAGLSLSVHSPWGDWEQTSPLIGSFNALNLLGAIGLAGLWGVPAQTIQEALAQAKGAPGRLEKVGGPGTPLILVDYAHTPAALETALLALRALKPRRLLAIIGCGGDRDRLKRPLMGEAAGRLADLPILTSDNPRTEDPLAIIEDARVGLERVAGPELTPRAAQAATQGNLKGYLIEPDRRKAIFLAVSLIQKGDILLIAGKGHEDYQIIGRQKLPFDDAKVAYEAVEARFGLDQSGHF